MTPAIIHCSGGIERTPLLASIFCSCSAASTGLASEPVFVNVDAHYSLRRRISVNHRGGYLSPPLQRLFATHESHASLAPGVRDSKYAGSPLYPVFITDAINVRPPTQRVHWPILTSSPISHPNTMHDILKRFKPGNDSRSPLLCANFENPFRCRDCPRDSLPAPRKTHPVSDSSPIMPTTRNDRHC